MIKFFSHMMQSKDKRQESHTLFKFAISSLENLRLMQYHIYWIFTLENNLSGCDDTDMDSTDSFSLLLYSK
jgi:hypothetical protein